MDAEELSSTLIEPPANVMLGESQDLDEEVLLVGCDIPAVDAVLTAVHDEFWELDDVVTLA